MSTITGVVRFDGPDDEHHRSAFTPDAVAALVGQEVTLTECMDYARPLARTRVDAAEFDGTTLTLTLAVERAVWGQDEPVWVTGADPVPLSVGYLRDQPGPAPVRLLQVAHTTPCRATTTEKEPTPA